MPLVATSDYLDDIARRRAQAQQFASTEQQASAMGINALQNAQKSDLAQREALRLERTQADAEAQQVVANKQNERDAALRLRQTDINERQTNDAMQRARHADDREQAAADRTATKDMEALRLRAIDDEVTASLAHGEGAPPPPMAQFGGDINPDAAVPQEESPERVIAERLRGMDATHDVPTSEVAAAYARKFDENFARDMGVKHTEQKIAEEVRNNKAQTGLGYAHIAAEERMAAEKAAAAGEKAAGKNSNDLTPLTTELKIADKIRERAKGLVGVDSMLQTGADKYAAHGNGAMPVIAGMMSAATKSDERAKLETDIADFIAHSVNALEQTKRAVSKEQAELMKNQLIGAIGTPGFDAKLEEVQRLLAEELVDRRAAGGKGGEVASAASAPVAAGGPPPSESFDWSR